jgi:hypothetical protein
MSKVILFPFFDRLKTYQWRYLIFMKTTECSLMRESMLLSRSYDLEPVKVMFNMWNWNEVI